MEKQKTLLAEDQGHFSMIRCVLSYPVHCSVLLGDLAVMLSILEGRGRMRGAPGGEALDHFNGHE